jgi:NAD+ kinase
MAAAKKLKIGVVVNRSKPGACDVLNQLMEFAVKHPNLKLLFEKRTGALIRQPGFDEKELARQSDLLLVAGGDGSLLDVVGAVYPTQVPILGVNIGSLGFLTAASETEVDTILPCLAADDLLYSSRLALETTFHRLGDRTHVIPCALNDVVISRVNISSLIRVRVEVGDYLVTEYVCDGLIIATPTGSTAYSLASGGPIMSPDANGIVINPICPHSLTNRALVVGIDQPIRVHIVPKRGVGAPAVQFDGRAGGSIRAHEWLEIKPAKHKVNLAYLPHSDFYRVLRQKLKWSGASV